MKTQLAFAIGLLLASPFAFAVRPLEGIDRSSLEASIEGQAGVDHATAVHIVNSLSDQFGTQPGQRIPISGWLFTHGFNFALLRDSDTWFMDATVQDDTGNWVTAKNLYQVEFQNGGFKFEMVYKFMLVFLTSDTSVKQLDGAVFGRGLGGTVTGGGGFEFGYMPGKNRSGGAFVAALKFGLGGGVQLPRMKFHLREVQP